MKKSFDLTVPTVPHIEKGTVGTVKMKLFNRFSIFPLPPCSANEDLSSPEHSCP